MSHGAEHSRRDIEFHRRTASGYDDETTREFGIYHAYALHPFLDRHARPGARAIDLGAGTGVVTIALVERGFEVIAVDHSAEMLAIARRKLAALALGARADLIEADFASDLVPAGEADVVTAQGVLHHLPDLRAGVAALARVLRPGGHFFISEPCVEVTPIGKAISWVFPAMLAARRLLLRLPANAAPPSVEAPISARELFHTLDERGLEYEAEFITHLPKGHRWAGDSLRIRVSRLISRPWRRHRGDIVFVWGRKPAAHDDG